MRNAGSRRPRADRELIGHAVIALMFITAQQAEVQAVTQPQGIIDAERCTASIFAGIGIAKVIRLQDTIHARSGRRFDSPIRGAGT